VAPKRRHTEHLIFVMMQQQSWTQHGNTPRSSISSTSFKANAHTDYASAMAVMTLALLQTNWSREPPRYQRSLCGSSKDKSLGTGTQQCGDLLPLGARRQKEHLNWRGDVVTFPARRCLANTVIICSLLENTIHNFQAASSGARPTSAPWQRSPAKNCQATARDLFFECLGDGSCKAPDSHQYSSC